MLKISPEDLTKVAKDKLADFQQQVDQKASHDDKYNEVNKLWNTSLVNPFREIKEKLTACSEIVLQAENNKVAYCQYCESDRNSAIEHIYPKSAFPGKAYQWENYIYACWYCNTKLKGSKYYVFQPQGSANDVELQGTGKKVAAPNDDLALIDPRVDDPTKILYLYLSTGLFIVNPSLDGKKKADRRQQIKGEKTRDLLKLNTSSTKRLDAYRSYLESLKRYVGIKESNNYDELNTFMATYIPSERVERKPDFEVDKQEILRRLKFRILQGTGHPTVWYEMKRQRKYQGFEQLDKLLEVAEIENW